MYDMLSPRQQFLVDFVLWSGYNGIEYKIEAAKVLGIAERTVKADMTAIFNAYGIDKKNCIPSVRLVYLRSKELGLIK